jgi:hypothetical protein
MADALSARAEAAGREIACPSAPCEEDSRLFGVIGPSGRVGYVLPSLPVTTEFARRAEAAGSPTKRFRFTAPCIGVSCSQWDGQGCRIGAALAAGAAAAGIDDAVLPECGIRDTCRWFDQEGAAACGVCPLVATDPA